MRNVVQRLYQLFSHEDRLLILIDPDPDAAVTLADAKPAKRLDVFERYLTVWVALCIVAGIALGQVIAARRQVS